MNEFSQFVPHQWEVPAMRASTLAVRANGMFDERDPRATLNALLEAERELRFAIHTLAVELVLVDGESEDDLWANFHLDSDAWDHAHLAYVQRDVGLEDDYYDEHPEAARKDRDELVTVAKAWQMLRGGPDMTDRDRFRHSKMLQRIGYLTSFVQE